jgi:hypothetical protein
MMFLHLLMKCEMMVVVFQIILDIAVEILKMIEEFQMQMEWR